MRALGVTLFDGEIDNVFSTAACYLYNYSTGINVLGHVVGADRTFGDDYRFGFLWRSSSSVKVFVDFQTIANGINDKDQVVGQTGGGELEEASKAVLWDNGFKTYLDTNVTVVDTEFSPGDSYCSGANGINDSGQVVGWSNMGMFQCPVFFFVNPQGVVHAFVWKAPAGMQDLGTLPGDTVSVARKINLFGQVIGSSGNTLAWQDGPPEGGGSVTVIGRPFIWSERSGMRDLNTLVRAIQSGCSPQPQTLTFGAKLWDRAC
jgi:probable HAF family extracellular repeat protein